MDVFRLPTACERLPSAFEGKDTRVAILAGDRMRPAQRLPDIASTLATTTPIEWLAHGLFPPIDHHFSWELRQL